jgi:two-component system response regulator DctR
VAALDECKWSNLFDEFKSVGSALVIILLTIRPTMKCVVDVLAWPRDRDLPAESIKRAVVTSSEKHDRLLAQRELQDRLTRLSTSERNMLPHMLSGKVNKLIAKQMGVAVRTVEDRRKRVFGKLKTRNMVDLVRLAEFAMRVDSPHGQDLPG